MYLFSINKKGTILLHPDALQLCPELAILEEKEARFIILAYDYESPFNQMPEEDRIHRAINLTYGVELSPDLKSKKFKNAIDAYKSLQYNPKRQLIKVYEHKLITLSTDLEKTNSSIEIKRILDSQKQIRVSLAELTNELSEQDEQRHIRGGGQLSFIEELHRNKEEYNRVTKPKKKA